MKLFRLTNGTWQPGNTIPKFDSLVWTERYLASGDFEIVVKNDISVLTTLPLGSMISHTDTREVMIVENHEVGRDSDKQLTVTVTGRGFETFAENRTTLGSAYPLNNPATNQPNVEVTDVLTSAAVAVNLLRAVLQPGVAASYNAIPGVYFDYDMRVFDSPMAHVLKRGDAYSRVLEILGLCGAGIRTERPYVGQSTLNVIVHDGDDRRSTVIFYAQREDLNDATYFWSIKDYKNYAFIATNTDARAHRHRDLSSDLTGFDRRNIYVEADDIKGIYAPPSASDVVASRAQSVLDEHRRIALLTATISPTARPKFKIHYDVGDLVTVFGEFSTAQQMRVTEHILTADEKGTHGYPSLSVV